MNLKKIPIDKETNFHFIGIGGYGLSGLAEFLYTYKYYVQGSDIKENENIYRLRSIGIKVMVPQKLENIHKDIDIVVISNAISDENPEIIRAQELGIQIISRTSLLKEILRNFLTILISGTHGKTSTTSIAAQIFSYSEINPSVINGGIMKDENSNIKISPDSNFIISEVDESDDTMSYCPSSYAALLLNIDRDHLENYENSFNTLKKSFIRFLHNVPFYGIIVVSVDCSNINNILQNNTFAAKLVTYSLDINNKNANFIATNITYLSPTLSSFDVIYKENNQIIYTIPNLKITIIGEHNISNALASISLYFSIIGYSKESINTLRDSLQNFSGTHRRFSYIGNYQKAIVIDDYAHHPNEISNTIQTVYKSLQGKSNSKLISVIEPHRYSRVKELFNEYIRISKLSDITIFLDIFSASEHAIDDISSRILTEHAQQYNLNSIIKYAHNYQMLQSIIDYYITENSTILFMGAGDSTIYARKLVG